MGIRDAELSRIEKYAQGLGVKLEWKKYERGGTDAEWHADGTKITIYQWPSKSKTTTVLTLIHELAHHVSWIRRGRAEDSKVLAAFEADSNWEPGQPTISKEHRRLIYVSERDDARLRDKIFQDLNIKIPWYKFVADKKVDVWYYLQFYLTGKRPTNKAYQEMGRLFVKQCRSKYADYAKAKA